VQTEAGSLDPVLTKDLLALRGLLDLAVRTARNQDDVSRSTAVVLLDAACERAVHMVAVSRAVAQKRDDFPQLLGNVRASLGEAWSPGHLPAIRKLHLARNKQQHEGLGSDRADVESWSVAAPGFIESIVFAAYGVSLGQVSLGLAIRRQDLRKTFEAAASLIEREEPEGAFSKLVELFQKAAEEWISFAGPINGFYSESLSFKPLDKESHDRLQRQIDRMWGMALYSPLAIDPGELAWFLQARREHLFADRHDAERGLNFVFWWLIAFEAAPAQEVVGRRARWHLARRRMRAENGPAVIEKAEWHSTSQLSGQLTLTIANVPRPETFEIWRKALQDLVRGESGRAGFQIDESGHASITVSDPEKLSRELERLNDALITAEDVLTAELEKLASAEAEAARVERERERKREAFSTALAECSLPAWVERIRVEAEPRRRSSNSSGSRLVLELATNGLVGTVASILRNGNIDARRENYSNEELILPFRTDPSEVLAELAPYEEVIGQLIAASQTWGEVPLSTLVTETLQKAGIPVTTGAQLP
jgi:hypothetical protein